MGGPAKRLSTGESFALMEMVLIPAIMSQRFTFDLAPGDRVECGAMLTLRPGHGVYVIGGRRS